MIKFYYLIIFTFLSLNSFSDSNQIIPNGNYEFTWKAIFVNDGSSRIDLLATDYVEIIDDKINFLHMPCHRGLDANLRYSFDYKFSSDLSTLKITGKDVGMWNRLYLKNNNDEWEKKDISFKFDRENIKIDDPNFYELKALSKHMWEDKISLTITRNSNVPNSRFKCLYERLDYESATPKTANDLKNGLSGVEKTKVFGKLFFPENTDQKVPLVITVHPSMGFVPTDYFKWFSDMGMAVFDTQPYLSRGIESQWFSEVSEEAATVDVYKALDILSKDPRIDKNKIILMGWSYGAMVVNNAHQQFFIDKIKPKNEFQAFISYYPFCSLIKENTKTSDKPLILLMGEKDRMCPFELCQDYFDIIKKSSPNSEIHIFEKSYHRFDFNLLPKALNIGRAETWNEEYLKDIISNNKRYDIGESHKDMMGPNGWSYISLLNDNEKDKLLDPFREDTNYIGYNKKTDNEARDIIVRIISEL